MPAGFVHDDQVGILVQDLERDGLGRGIDLRRLLHGDHDAVRPRPASAPQIGDDRAVHCDRAGLDQAARDANG